MPKLLVPPTPLSAVAPNDVSTLAAVGTSTSAARADHVHAVANNAIDTAQLAAGAVTNNEVDTNAAIAVSKLAAGQDKQILVCNGANPPSYVDMSGDATISATGVVTLANTAVGAGSYTAASITVDSKGRLTAASSNSITQYVAQSFSYPANGMCIGGGKLNANLTRYTNLTGLAPWQAEEFASGDQPLRLGVNGTVVKIWIELFSNTVTASSTCALRNVTTAATLGTITIPASTGGYLEATGLSGAVSDGDVLEWKFITGATGTSMRPASLGVIVALTNVT